jgi:NhaP-type Na+/H+ or K+/H+ antiporter
VFVVDGAWSAALRSVALVVILARAGLGLDLANVYRLSASVLRLAALPNLAEAAVDAAMARALLGMPWLWACMTGFVLSAVSPAVVVPSLLRLKDMRYGTAKGIPDLVLAAASFDDVLSISGFGICLGLAFSAVDAADGGGGDQGGGGRLAWDILRGPVELLVGILGGVLIGWICGVLGQHAPVSPLPGRPARTPLTASEKRKMHSQLAWLRIALVMGFGCLAVFGGIRTHFTGAGALAVIIEGLVAKRVWSKGSDKNAITRIVSAHLKAFWVGAAEPFLFVLIGASVSVTFLNGTIVGQSLAVLIVGLCVRLLVSVLCVYTKQFTQGERLFISMAWLPKATVQAAIGAVALDAARARLLDLEKTHLANSTAISEAKTNVQHGQNILTLAVLAILVTAPIGAALIALCGPRLLDRESGGAEERVEEEEKDELRQDRSTNELNFAEDSSDESKLEFEAELTSRI